MNDELQPLAASEQADDVAVTDAPSPVVFSFSSCYADILRAARVIDHKSRVDTRRNIQSLGVMLILWMFIPELFKNPAQITGWIMTALAIALGVMLWKYPDYSNRKFAADKAAREAEISLSVDESGITFLGAEPYVVSYDDVVGIYDYKNIIVVQYKRNHVLTISKDQLAEETRVALRAMLGERRTDIAPFKEPIDKKNPKTES